MTVISSFSIDPIYFRFFIYIFQKLILLSQRYFIYVFSSFVQTCFNKERKIQKSLFDIAAILYVYLHLLSDDQFHYFGASVNLKHEVQVTWSLTFNMDKQKLYGKGSYPRPETRLYFL